MIAASLRVPSLKKFYHDSTALEIKPFIKSWNGRRACLMESLSQAYSFGYLSESGVIFKEFEWWKDVDV
jgi:hypothetical protein